MMASPKIAESAVAPASPLKWRVHLAAAQPRRAALVVSAGIGAAALCLVLFGNWLFALLTVVMLFSATSEFLLPVSFTLDETGAEMRHRFGIRRMGWQEVRKAYLQPDGIKLSPLGRRTRLEAFRGVFLRFAGNQDEVLAAVRRYREPR